MSNLINAIKDMYIQTASPDKIALTRVYADNITFKDPIHEIKGLERLAIYLRDMAKNINYCKFDFIDEITDDTKAFLHWNMDVSHPKLNKGKLITLSGVSKLYFRERIFYHEDFYDLGALIYEQVPIIGRVNRSIKARLSA